MKIQRQILKRKQKGKGLNQNCLNETIRKILIENLLLYMSSAHNKNRRERIGW